MEAKLQKQAPQKAQANKPNLTGIPTQMKLDFEQRSGLSFDDVRVHYNSDKPAQLQALAYTQGTQVYIGPGQERHLKHELGHVVQQKNGDVRPTCYINGLPINDQDYLERKADTLQVFPKIYQSQIMQADFKMPIQRKISIKYDYFKPANPWIIEQGERPNFTSIIQHLFTDVFFHGDLGYNKTRSINHVISYYTINLLLRGLLSKQLNNMPSPKKLKGDREIKDNIKDKSLDWYNLMRMIIPKKTDYIVLHNLWEMENIMDKVCYTLSKHPAVCFTNVPYFNDKLKGFSQEKLKYIEILENQRVEALRHIDTICTLLSNDEVSPYFLETLVNKFESLLNCSVGNLRLGDFSTNSTIGSYIDPFADSFKLDHNTTNNTYTIIFDDRSQQNEGKLIEAGKSSIFHSKEKSMAKRMLALLQLNNALTAAPSSYIEGTDQVLPAFYLQYFDDGTGKTGVHVLTSDIVQKGLLSSFNTQTDKLRIQICHRKKGAGEVIEYSADIKPENPKVGVPANKCYNTFQNVEKHTYTFTGSTSTAKSGGRSARNLTKQNLISGELHITPDSKEIVRYSNSYPSDKRATFLSDISMLSALQQELLSLLPSPLLKSPLKLPTVPKPPARKPPSLSKAKRIKT